jgi:hypothetical protein
VCVLWCKRSSAACQYFCARMSGELWNNTLNYSSVIYSRVAKVTEAFWFLPLRIKNAARSSNPRLTGAEEAPREDGRFNFNSRRESKPRLPVEERPSFYAHLPLQISWTLVNELNDFQDASQFHSSWHFYDRSAIYFEGCLYSKKSAPSESTLTPCTNCVCVTSTYRR